MSVRRLSEVVEGRPVYRDVVGVLVSWDDACQVTVVPRAGEPVSFPAELMIAAKTVPLFPARRTALPETEPTALQALASRGWAAADQQRLGDWLLRASGGHTKRANSCQALGDPGLPLAEATAAVGRWYAERGLPALFEVSTPGTDPALVAELDALGERIAPTEVRTAPLAPVIRAGAGTERVRLHRAPDEGWFERYHGGADPATAEAARALLLGGPSVWFAAVPAPGGGAPLAIGRCVVDGPWVLFNAVETAPEARRQGLATAVMSVLAARAAEEGATGAFLQVEADNTAARTLYDRLGFTTSHTYHYARLPQR
ncbi:GNAT family N-acetyltransferase [Kitasatospora sp. MMS16-BH015]|uniref:GNAT family N-acetyltransferase n=1 Tax=Kitasatospora sp. MMS16-BH015 TaxID=2018025 RepID=UPI00352D9ACC